ncbi:hypothetical protein [Pseudomonas sp. Q1-7]|uniref:hypothetical protein n=1 Tax=Pseudomonas sp. Q1-7 TaxID=3020843 RepID=UPI0022FFDF71|nr:hypothetical protein [Pseudomonas sp. Q1-7]
MKERTQERVELNTSRALSFLGHTVLAELAWDDEPRSLWNCYHIVGVVLPVEGIYEAGYFLVMNALEEECFLDELFWSDIHSMKTLERRRLKD